SARSIRPRPPDTVRRALRRREMHHLSSMPNRPKLTNRAKLPFRISRSKSQLARGQLDGQNQIPHGKAMGEPKQRADTRNSQQDASVTPVFRIGAWHKPNLLAFRLG